MRARTCGSNNSIGSVASARRHCNCFSLVAGQTVLVDPGRSISTLTAIASETNTVYCHQVMDQPTSEQFAKRAESP